MRIRTTLVPLTFLAIPALTLAVLFGPANIPPAAATPPVEQASPSHDIYNPARTALVNAQLQLAGSAGLEKEILERVQRMQRELDSSLTLLAEANRLDPSMGTTIDSLRARLSALRDNPAILMESSGADSAYTQILDEIQALIDRY